MARFTDSQTGALILQTAQSLIALNRQKKRMEMEQKQFDANAKMQARNFELREKNAAIQEQFAEAQLRTIELKEKGEEQASLQAAAELDTERARARKIKVETDRLLSGKGERDPSITEALKIANRINTRFMGNALASAAQKNGINLLANDSVDSLREERLTLIKQMGQFLPQDQMEATRQRVQSIERLLQDPDLLQADAAARNFSIPQEAIIDAVKEEMFNNGTPISDSDAAAIGQSALQTEAGIRAGTAGGRVFGGTSDSTVRELVEDFSTSGNITPFARLVQQQVLRGGQVDSQAQIRIVRELLRLGVPQQQAFDLVKATVTELSQ